MRWMAVLGVLGLLSGGTGLYLLSFTSITCTGGMGGIALVVVLITLGVFMLVPAKIYLILKLTRNAKARKVLKP